MSQPGSMKWRHHASRIQKGVLPGDSEGLDAYTTLHEMLPVGPLCKFILTDFNKPDDWLYYTMRFYHFMSLIFGHRWSILWIWRFMESSMLLKIRAFYDLSLSGGHIYSARYVCMHWGDLRSFCLVDGHWLKSSLLYGCSVILCCHWNSLNVLCRSVEWMDTLD